MYRETDKWEGEVKYLEVNLEWVGEKTERCSNERVSEGW